MFVVIMKIVKGAKDMKRKKAKIIKVKWEYEDQLPALIDSEYNAMFKYSCLSEGAVGVRIFPYIEHNQKRFYLAK